MLAQTLAPTPIRRAPSPTSSASGTGYPSPAVRSRVPTVVLSLLALCGCYPSMHKYYRASVPGAEYRKNNCVGYTSAYYEYHGIFISLSFGDAGYPLLKVYVPHGTVVQVNDEVMSLRGKTQTGVIDVTMMLQAAFAGLDNVGWMRARAAGTRSSPDNFGPLNASDEPGALAWYAFGTHTPIPAGVSDGTLRLPSLTINGQRYESQSVSFTQKAFVGVLPVNC